MCFQYFLNHMGFRGLVELVLILLHLSIHVDQIWKSMLTMKKAGQQSPCAMIELWISLRLHFAKRIYSGRGLFTHKQRQSHEGDVSYNSSLFLVLASFCIL